MNTTAAIVIAIAVVVVLAAVAFLTLARRSDVRGAGALSNETVRRDVAKRAESPAQADAGHPTGAEVEAAAVAARSSALVPVEADTGLTPWVAPDPEALGVSRRQFFNRATISLMGAGLGTFSAAAFVAFLWPTKTGGFGGKVPIGRYDDVISGIRTGSGFFYAPNARAWITAYPSEALSKAEAVYPESLLTGMRQGIIAQYQKCPHLGCRVPQCISSQWFECGCHGSQYNRVGEKKGGPAPRGMDHFPIEISPAGDVVIDTNPSTIVLGMAIGTNTTGQEAEGSHCVGAAEH